MNNRKRIENRVANKDFFKKMYFPEGDIYNNIFIGTEHAKMAMFDNMSNWIDLQNYDVAIEHGEIAFETGLFYDDNEEEELVGYKTNQHLMVLAVLVKHLGKDEVDKILQEERYKNRYFKKDLMEYYKRHGI